jgi:hypothetical protein
VRGWRPSSPGIAAGAPARHRLLWWRRLIGKEGATQADAPSTGEETCLARREAGPISKTPRLPAVNRHFRWIAISMDIPKALVANSAELLIWAQSKVGQSETASTRKRKSGLHGG